MSWELLQRFIESDVFNQNPFLSVSYLSYVEKTLSHRACHSFLTFAFALALALALALPFFALPCPILSYPILSYPTLSCPILPYHTSTCPTLTDLVHLAGVQEHNH